MNEAVKDTLGNYVALAAYRKHLSLPDPAEFKVKSAHIDDLI